ncbi:hypothetical protein Ae168Ps1_1400c [Pseudonocardia sp. Ae168_Ps1]|jgi:hypothetical protein|nr:hypothetical protein Ae150APs1_1396c [Pseudonocardia sp. Ae150A_Ps1]OLL78994.1 hypothetical protein Ae168Ps1_1400c [Pseudonocardia sp. Ae168_Ps1]OLL86868.1 hypothetical protein Ae263Ps1_3923 [Pseudonocardia sp. Ae263_Ps1]OLL93087.1 hypothetical protein Ae356Ps1_2984c [Pseudonocardia sp. Ae356_Ps1]OLM19561.1 hypothetical protein Ae707Ps1_3820c [Pseudonocardia sp. Ae707_Ps1]
MSDTLRVLRSGLGTIARRIDAYTLQAFNPVYPTPAGRGR